jgi:hypothetical protein
MSNDPDLRARFAALRRQDAARTPGFTQVLQRTRRAFITRTSVLAATACLLIAVIAVSLIWISQNRSPPAPPNAAPSLADWRAPTDFLLNIPGQVLLRTVPRIGEPSDMLRLRPDLYDITPTRRIGQEHHS